jgi:argininosuccinate synthase
VTAAVREPRPVNLRMRDSPHWGAYARPVVTSKIVEVGDSLPGGWVVVAGTTERGADQVWLAKPEGDQT